MVRISGKATKELYHKKSQHVSICQYGTQTLYYKYGPVKYFLSFLSDSPNLRRAHGTSVNKEMEWITGESVKEQSLLISFHWVRGIHVWFE